ncbi:MAG: aspartate-semialdehyde dehydrogenase [Deltaproteobacteria bacterium]|nr:aspartate-semialdehyde dehydrogenase [Deltaproteobacteria bacterium]MCB9785869.1 aspartate-semialdehyde dehydrogenase [Deltaproteobacteria bacterium]
MKKNVAIVGATGAVGQELLAVLERLEYPVGTLRPLASPRSAGSTVRFAGRDVTVEVAGPESFAGIDVAFFSAGATRSRELVPHAREAGALVIDNSSAFRMTPDVPLVVPEVNPEALRGHQGVIANPNCVAAILTVALAPLRQLGAIRRLVIATYQSASGAGARAMEDLEVQTRAALAGEPVVAKVLRHPYAFNLFSHDSAVEDNLYNGEENKVVAETRKILGQPDLGISITCVRVPVLRAHTEVVNVEFDRAVDVEAARDVLAAAPGLALVDDPAENHFPMPNETSGTDAVRVGRVRRDPSCDHALNLLICGDQLLKGAALNAVQIAQALQD